MCDYDDVLSNERTSLNENQGGASSHDPVLISVIEAARLLSVCRATLYKLINADLLTLRYVGRRALLLRSDVVAFANNLPQGRR